MPFRAIIFAYHRAYSGLPQAVWLFAVAMFINRMGTMVLAFLALYLDSRGYNEQAATGIMSVYGVGSIAGAYIGGRLTSKLGSVRAQILLLLASVPMFIWVPLSEGWWGIAIAVFCLSVTADGVRPASVTSIAEYSPMSVRSKSFGLHRMAANLGGSIGPALGGWLSAINFFWIFVVDAGTTMMCGLFLLWWFGWKATPPLSDESESSTIVLNKANHSEGSPLRNWNFVAFLGLNLLTATVFFQFLSTYPLYLKDHFGMSRPEIGALYAVNTVMIVVLEMLLVSWLAKFSQVAVLAVGGMLCCIGFGMLPLSHEIWFAVVAMIVLTFGEMLWMPIASSWVSAQHTAKQQAAAMGWYVMTYSISFVISPLVSGALYSIDKSLPWYISFLMASVVGGGYYWLARSEMPRARRTEPEPC